MDEQETWDACVAAAIPDMHECNARWKAEAARVERGWRSTWGIESKAFRLGEETGAAGSEAPRGRSGVGMGPLIRPCLCLPRSECPSIVFAYSLSISRVV